MYSRCTAYMYRFNGQAKVCCGALSRVNSSYTLMRLLLKTMNPSRRSRHTDFSPWRRRNSHTGNVANGAGLTVDAVPTSNAARHTSDWKSMGHDVDLALWKQGVKLDGPVMQRLGRVTNVMPESGIYVESL